MKFNLDPDDSRTLSSLREHFDMMDSAMSALLEGMPAGSSNEDMVASAMSTGFAHGYQARAAEEQGNVAGAVPADPKASKVIIGALRQLNEMILADPQSAAAVEPIRNPLAAWVTKWRAAQEEGKRVALSAYLGDRSAALVCQGKERYEESEYFDIGLGVYRMDPVLLDAVIMHWGVDMKPCNCIGCMRSAVTANKPSESELNAKVAVNPAGRYGFLCLLGEKFVEVYANMNTRMEEFFGSDVDSGEMDSHAAGDYLKSALSAAMGRGE